MKENLILSILRIETGGHSCDNTKLVLDKPYNLFSISTTVAICQSKIRTFFEQIEVFI